MIRTVTSFTGNDLVMLYRRMVVEGIDDVGRLTMSMSWPRVKVEKAIRFLRLHLDGKFPQIANPITDVERVTVDSSGKFSVKLRSTKEVK